MEAEAEKQMDAPDGAGIRQLAWRLTRRAERQLILIGYFVSVQRFRCRLSDPRQV